MGTRHRYGQSALFLVRVYADRTIGGAGESTGDPVECHGRVQRVVDGETRAFSTWRDLVDVLHELLSNEKGR
jgi:hypothetical protein